jgi:GntR family transcriptional regulator/MocR family aminotransferase
VGAEVEGPSAVVEGAIACAESRAPTILLDGGDSAIDEDQIELLWIPAASDVLLSALESMLGASYAAHPGVAELDRPDSAPQVATRGSGQERYEPITHALVPVVVPLLDWDGTGVDVHDRSQPRDRRWRVSSKLPFLSLRLQALTHSFGSLRVGMNLHRRKVRDITEARDQRLLKPEYVRLYEQLCSAILSGQLAPGSRLPSSRQLAGDRGLSRNTALAAYEQLIAEGYVEARRGSGTYVARSVPDQAMMPRRFVGSAWQTLSAPRPTPRDQPHAVLSTRGRVLANLPRMPMSELPVQVAGGTAFRVGLPALDEFPVAAWTEIHATAARYPTVRMMRYHDPLGDRRLREEIAAHLATFRGIECSPDEVMVVSGSQQGIDLAARVLLDPGDAVWLEDPGGLGARAALVAAGADIVPVAVDLDGMNVAAGVKRRPDARMAFVTPSHQFPTGVTMSIERRLALLDWATRNDAWIVEDDQDCEFRYEGRPLAALKSADESHRVIYVGTFSRSMFPGLRLGYLVLPSNVTNAFVAARLSTDIHRGTVDQVAMAEFMARGGFARHLRRLRMIHRERQGILVSELGRLIPEVTVLPSCGGLHLVARLPSDNDDVVASAAAAARGIHAWALSAHVVENRQPPSLLLGYAGVRPAHMTAATHLLAEVLRDLKERHD